MPPRATRSRSRRAFVATATAVALMTMASCSSGPHRPGGTRVPVTLRDYRISASTATLSAGLISFDIVNRGPSTHEFVVFETDRAPDRMPLGTDGLTIDEDSPAVRHIGELAQVDVGRSTTLALRLSPGTYVFICNMEGHYLGGMHTQVTVH